MKKRVEKKGVKSGYGSGKLSSQQSEILYLLTKEYLTPKNIAIKRGTHISAVYKTINKLKKKIGIREIKKYRTKTISLKSEYRTILHKLERYNKCLLCGYSKIIHLHHIEKGLNIINNILPLCPNCHYEIHKFGYSKDSIIIIKDFTSIDILEEIEKYNDSLNKKNSKKDK